VARRASTRHLDDVRRGLRRPTDADIARLTKEIAPRGGVRRGGVRHRAQIARELELRRKERFSPVAAKLRRELKTDNVRELLRALERWRAQKDRGGKTGDVWEKVVGLTLKEARARGLDGAQAIIDVIKTVSPTRDPKMEEMERLASEYERAFLGID
jgi:hypothetical protein